MNKQKQAFTLVELIVTITILVILGAIAFISLQGYSKQARDSLRLSDLSNIKTSLELFHLDSGKYPDPTEAQPITYSGGLAWYQGIFGNSTFINVDKLDIIPKDPITNKEYTYSLLNTKQEYQLAGIIEGGEESSFLLPNTNAVTKTAKALVRGTYNGMSLRVNTNDISYVLAIPSIITSINLTQQSNRELETIIPTKNLVLSNYENLPNNYLGSNYDSMKETTNSDFEIVKDNSLSNVLIYEGNLEGLTSEILVTKLKEAYSGTTIEQAGNITELISLSSETIDEEEQLDTFGVHFINNYLGGSTQMKIYATCDGIAHNTTKSFYTGTGVTFTEGTCDILKKDFVCRDGIWKDGEDELDTETYAYELCTVEEAEACTYLETSINHGDSLLVYSQNTINWDSIENCSDEGIEGTVICNDGIVEGDISYVYKVCAKGSASNCAETPSYDNEGEFIQSYNIPELVHGNTYTGSLDISENNGIFRYSVNSICNNGVLNSSETGPVLQNCDANFTQEGEQCKSYCETGTFDGYTYSDIQHTQTENVLKDTSPLNGVQETTTTLTCTNGIITKGDESEGVITCNTGYYLNGVTCNSQWSGDASSGFVYKNTSGTVQYPTSCSELLNQTAWQNTYAGSPWNLTKFVDGNYYIKPDSSSAFKVYCDMTSEGGGWTRYANIKGNYTQEAALNCYKGAHVSDNQLDCFNPNRFGISANEYKVNILGNDYISELSYGSSYSTNTLRSTRYCTGHGDYFTTMNSGGTYPGTNPSEVGFVRLGKNYCIHGRQVGSVTSSPNYMNYASGGNGGPVPGAREENATPAQLFIRDTNTDKALELVNGGYMFNTSTYSHSCESYKDSPYYANEGDGTYWIKPNHEPAFKVYCDMTTDGGGRTQLTDWTTSSYYVNDLENLADSFSELYYSYKRGGTQKYAFKFNKLYTVQCGNTHGSTTDLKVALRDYVSQISTGSWGTCTRDSTVGDANDIIVEKILSDGYVNDACLSGTLHKDVERNFSRGPTTTSDGKSVGTMRHRISDITILFGPTGEGSGRCSGVNDSSKIATEINIYIR